MLDILRLTNVAFAALLFTVQFIMGVVASLFNSQSLLSNAFNYVNWISIGINIGIFLLYNLGLYINIFHLAQVIRQHKIVRNRYTTVWFCGRWLFMIFASLFWIIRAIGYAVPIWTMFRKVPRKTQ